jgi:hypothetical protein
MSKRYGKCLYKYIKHTRYTMNSWSQYITDFLLRFPSYLPFFIILGIVGFILYRAHEDTNQKFTIFDLIEDNGTGKGSLEKIGMLLAQLSLTWWFIDLAASAKATYEEALAYGAIMGVSKFASNFLSAKYGRSTPADSGDK